MTTQKQQPVSRKGRGTIAALMVLLLGSAGLRLVSGAEYVMASTSGDDISAVAPGPAQQTEEVRDLGPVLQAFQEREARIEQEEAEISRRAALLEESEAEIREQINILKETEEKLRATIALAADAAENDLARLTEVYENMKPKTAAAIFQEMAPEFAAGFLGRMRPDSAAAVLAGIPAEQAYAISAILAGRNADVPKN